VARTLIDTMADDYDPTQYHDEYREALEEVVQAKATGGEVRRPEEPEQKAPVVDLVAALKASVEAAKKSRGQPAKDAKESKAGSKSAGTDADKDADKDADGSKRKTGTRGRQRAAS
jgi:DNA end-binding protein Ku